MPCLVIAHRGAPAELPENTLAAFRRAVARGADAIELDVQVTRDGVPVVFHDADLLRLTGFRGHIARRTFGELRPLRIHGREPIPRLVDVLRYTRGRVLVQIELKAGASVAPVIRAIRAARAARWVILASFSPGLLRTCRRVAPAIPRMLIAEGGAGTAALLRQLGALGATGLSVHHAAVSGADWLRPFQSRGLVVWCWTVNTPVRMRRLAGWGVDGILSDNPALLCRTLRQKSPALC